VPHEFVLDALEPIGPVTKPMFGCLAVYVREKVVLILRDHRDHPADNGVWLATTAEHHDSLRREFPHMRSIQLFGTPVTSWQVLPPTWATSKNPRCTRASWFSHATRVSAKCRAPDRHSEDGNGEDEESDGEGRRRR
jgi:hypothetical protein